MKDMYATNRAKHMKAELRPLSPNSSSQVSKITVSFIHACLLYYLPYYTFTQRRKPLRVWW